MRRKIACAVACLAVATLTPPLAAAAEKGWDGLVKLKSKRLDTVYLMPEADFRTYSKVIIEGPQISFRKNWQRVYQGAGRGGPTDEDIRSAIDQASQRFQGMLQDAYKSAGFQIADKPGPDVLRVSTAIVNASVTPPDRGQPGGGHVFGTPAGEGQLVIEARDSLSGALLGRALDHRIIGNEQFYLRDAMLNRAEFDRMFARWAQISAVGMNELKEMSPIDLNGRGKK
jgi:hypothetical protein